MAWATLVLVLAFGAVLAIWGPHESGLRQVIRYSARTSLLLFLLAFVASATHRLWTSAPSKWLLCNRRYVGVSFAVSHGLHGLAIFALAQTVPGSLATLGPLTIGVGALGYVFVLSMAATSFDRTTGWLGLSRWRRLHKTGMYVLWFVFFASYAPSALAGAGLGILFVGILVGGLGLRFLAGKKRRA